MVYEKVIPPAVRLQDKSRISDFTSQISNLRSHTPDIGPQISDLRFQISDLKFGILAGLLLCCFFSVFSTAVSAAPRVQNPDLPADAEQATFIKGQNLYNQGLYHQATAVFGDFLKAYPNSLVKDLALLWLGRSYMRVGDVPAAEQIGMRLREIPDTPFVSIYEEELRAARQSYVRAALPSVKVEPSSVAVESPKSLPTKVPTPLPTSSPIITSALSKTSARDESPAKETAQGKLSSIEKNQKPKVDEVINAAPDIAPRVRIRMEQSTRETAASNAIFYRLVISNEGKGTAREIIVSELLSESSQFASSNPAPARQDPVARTQRLTFRVVELKPGESRTLSIAVRPRNVGSSTDNILKTKHSVSYQDSQGKTYQND